MFEEFEKQNFCLVLESKVEIGAKSLNSSRSVPGKFLLQNKGNFRNLIKNSLLKSCYEIQHARREHFQKIATK